MSLFTELFYILNGWFALQYLLTMRLLVRNIAKLCTGPQNAQQHLTVFSSKSYDQQYFTKMNQTLSPQKQFKLDFFESELSYKTTRLIPPSSNTVICFVNDKLDSQAIKSLKSHNVDLIALRCAGFNNVDLKQAEKQGITVVRVPVYSPHAVAQHTMALLMTLNRKIHKAYNRTRDNNFSLEGLIGFDMFQKTMGIVGFGRIGQQFSRICNGYGMKVLVNDIVSDQTEELQKNFNVKFVERETLFQQSDVISLHCPLTPSTKHMINQDSIQRMKKNCIIINTGRGALINTKEVLDALAMRQIGGLALDVYEQEQGIFFNDHSLNIIKDEVLSQLLSYPNVILTSHQAFFTHEALTAISKVTINNILEFRKTGKCQNEVKIKKN